MASARNPSAALPSRLRLSLGLNGARRLSAIGILAAAAALAGIGAPHRTETVRVVRARAAMGTILEIEAFGRDAGATEAGVAAAFRTVDEVESRLSNWRPGSEISRANTGRPFSLSPATWGSLTRAFALARETGGAFDPTVGAVTRIDPSRARPEAVGWRKARLDPRGRRLSFSVAGGTIDTGGFAKGEALDRALVALRSHGVRAARLNFGGQISLFGSSETGRGDLGTVSIAEPRPGSSRELARFRAEDGSVSTSGQSEQAGHIVDPSTGAAVTFRGSVTVVADTGTRADALSTALFVLGPARGIAFADRRGIAALYVVPRGRGWQFVPSREFPRFRRFV
jgi:thiamine biosynthesis lipoprotein